LPVAAGVDGCRGGWIAAHGSSSDAVSAAVFPTLSALCKALGDASLIAIDMPLGLPERIDGSGRGPEQAIRPLLGARQSSVFAIPARSAIYAVDPQPQGLPALLEGHRLSSSVALAHSDPPRGVAFQTFNIFPKIREADRLLLANPDWIGRMREVHPELAFWRMNGSAPLQHPKKIRGKLNPAGSEERRALLERHGIPDEKLRSPVPRGAAADDWLDALACYVSASRMLQGKARSYPPVPARDARGIPAAIWTWE
jgi:predicted RNase H-like nuclease